MRERPEILYLAHRIPYPPDKGDKIRAWRFVAHLAKRFDVHLAAFVDDPADFSHRAFLEGVCASVHLIALHPLLARLKSAKSLLVGDPLTYGYYDDVRMRSVVRQLRTRPLAAEITFSSSMAQYVQRAAGAPRIADICDADSKKWREYAQAVNGPMRWIYAREHQRLAAAETGIINDFEAALAISDAEAAILAGRPGVTRRVIAVGNGVDAEYFSPAHSFASAVATDVVFVGAMDYKPNADAALWFAQDVWPRVRNARPDATFAIVGPRPPETVARLNGVGGVTVTGRVADVRPFLQAAKTVVAPLKIARGVQNKVLEAMAMAKPVVATTAANTGIGAAPGVEILIADDAHSSATAVISLLGNDRRRAAIGEASRARVMKDFTWNRQLARLDAALHSVGVSPP